MRSLVNEESFLGWFTEKNGGTQVTADTLCTGEATYYAHWNTETETTYTVTLYNGLSQGSSFPYYGEYGSPWQNGSKTVPSGTVLNDLPPNVTDEYAQDELGYGDFTGWYLEKDDTATAPEPNTQTSRLQRIPSSGLALNLRHLLRNIR